MVLIKKLELYLSEIEILNIIEEGFIKIFKIIKGEIQSRFFT